MINYRCKFCSFSTGSRKWIRDHVKGHGIKGTGAKNKRRSISDITAAYRGERR